jgi:hypothetical protein
MTTQAGIIRGTAYLGKGSGALLAAGNASKCSYSIETEDKELPDYQNPGGGLDDSFTRLKSSRIAFSFRHLKKHILELVTGGTSTAETVTTVTDEAHNDVVLGGLIATAKAMDTSVAPVVKVGAATKAAGTDYTVVRAGIILPATGGTILAGDDVLISYTSIAAGEIQGMLSVADDYHVIFDGINERTNLPILADWFRVQFGPAKNIEFIGDDYVSFDVEGKLLKDETKTGTGVSQYYTLRIGGLTN